MTLPAFAAERRLLQQVSIIDAALAGSGVTSHRQLRQCRGAQNGKGGPK